MEENQIDWIQYSTKYNLPDNFSSISKNKNISYEHIAVNQYKEKAKMCSFKTSCTRLKFWIKAMEDIFWEEAGKNDEYSVNWRDTRKESNSTASNSSSNDILDEIIITLSDPKTDEKLNTIKLHMGTGTITSQGNEYHKFRDYYFPLMREKVNKYDTDSQNEKTENPTGLQAPVENPKLKTQDNDILTTNNVVNETTQVEMSQHSSITESIKDISIVASSVDRKNKENPEEDSEYETDTEIILDQPKSPVILKSPVTPKTPVTVKTPITSIRKSLKLKNKNTSNLSTVTKEIKEMRKENSIALQTIQNSLTILESKYVENNNRLFELEAKIDQKEPIDQNIPAKIAGYETKVEHLSNDFSFKTTSIKMELNRKIEEIKNNTIPSIDRTLQFSMGQMDEIKLEQNEFNKQLTDRLEKLENDVNCSTSQLKQMTNSTQQEMTIIKLEQEIVDLNDKSDKLLTENCALKAQIMEFMHKDTENKDMHISSHFEIPKKSFKNQNKKESYPVPGIPENTNIYELLSNYKDGEHEHDYSTRNSKVKDAGPASSKGQTYDRNSSNNIDCLLVTDSHGNKLDANKMFKHKKAKVIILPPGKKNVNGIREKFNSLSPDSLGQVNIICAGSNDLTSEETQAVVNNICKLESELKTKYPDKQFLILNAIERIGQHFYNRKVAEFNREIEKVLGSEKVIKHRIQARKHYLYENDIHLGPSGIKVLVRSIKEKINPLLGLKAYSTYDFRNSKDKVKKEEISTKDKLIKIFNELLA